MKNQNRRDFLKTASLATLGTFVLPRISIGKPGAAANSKVNIAMIGAGGIASMAYGPCSSENIVALCDVDETTLNKEGAKYPKAAKFADFRVMLDKMGKDIDAVCVNTPDHTHFAATMEAMQRGKHVCTQKPLTHNVWQARTLRKAKDKYKVITNMANQGHTYDGIREMKEWLEAGILGQVSEVHCGFGGPNWNSVYFKKPPKMPLAAEPIPAGFNWDLWRGPVADEPYSHFYQPRTWRGFWKFGDGMLGDWFCHIGDGPVWILDLYAPTVVECVERAENAEGVIPDHSIVRWDFPARGTKAPCSMYWYDGMDNGGKKVKVTADWSWTAPNLKTGGTNPATPPITGSYWTGSKACAYLDERSNHPRLTDMAKNHDLKNGHLPPPKYPRVKGGPHVEWINAIKGGPVPGSNFDYSVPLSEVTLLGVLAQRFGGRIEWDSVNMKVTNRPELNAFINEPAREGWQYGADLWKA